ncbi:MAG: PAP/fibrillin family protein, partial [Microcystaceae cyanobacterium]
MAIEIGKREGAKTALREALVAYGGDTKHEVVAAAIERLCHLNPTTAPAHCGSLLDSEWLLISAPNFPQGEQREDGKFVYTLGRLAFNMFQPEDLKVVIDRVLQPVWPLANGEQHSHDILVEFTTIDERFPQQMGVIRNLGVCQPISDAVLQVK